MSRVTPPNPKKGGVALERKMPISAQEWRVRTGLFNASRVRTVSVFRSSKPTASVPRSPRANHDSAPVIFVPSPPGGREIVAWNGQPAPPSQVSRREGNSCSSALTEIPSSTWMGWKALFLCLIAPLTPKLITVLITICHVLIGCKGMLLAVSSYYNIVFIIQLVILLKLRVPLWPGSFLLLTRDIHGLYYL